MFLHVAEEVGKEYGLEPVQHLDLLVRDWTSSQLLGAEGGEQHLRDVREDLAATSPCKHPKALAVLGRSSSRCYLMPCPGKRIATGSAGALRDMDEDFREGLRDYVTALVGSAGRHVRRDQRGEPLTRRQDQETLCPDEEASLWLLLPLSDGHHLPQRQSPGQSPRRPHCDPA
nr:RING finger protein 112-like [Pelodiscus sinensis]|eukprot:XP_014428322.1 RING finger protein 112-like [Pelodiscus sinensis]